MQRWMRINGAPRAPRRPSRSANTKKNTTKLSDRNIRRIKCVGESIFFRREVDGTIFRNDGTTELKRNNRGVPRLRTKIQQSALSMI
jgi:hypothetical protein